MNKRPNKKVNQEPKEEFAYISNFTTKFNPDLLTPGGALKGNMYFKQKNGEVEEGETVQEQPVADSDSDDEFNRLKTQVARYYADENPTIKCRNCKQFGHIGRDCPNERQRLNCILCGKDTHESFDCTEKLCFKCNKVGHKASECGQKNIDMCH